MNEKLDIKEILAAIDLKEKDLYRELSDSMKKSFSPMVIMKWLSSVKNSKLNEDYLNDTNELLNKNLWSLYKHPELLYKLMTVIGKGSIQYHEWLSFTKTSLTPKIDNLLIELYPMLNDDEINIIKLNMSKNDLIQLLKDISKPDNEIKDYINEYSKNK